MGQDGISDCLEASKRVRWRGSPACPTFGTFGSCTPAVRRTSPSEGNHVAAVRACELHSSNTTQTRFQEQRKKVSGEHKMLLFYTGVRVWNILHICPFPNGDWDSPSKSTEKMYQFCHLNEVNNCGDWTFGEHVPQGGPPPVTCFHKCPEYHHTPDICGTSSTTFSITDYQYV